MNASIVLLFVVLSNISSKTSTTRSFLASLAPDLRQEILLTADDG